jgi:hypothetical protein
MDRRSFGRRSASQPVRTRAFPSPAGGGAQAAPGLAGDDPDVPLTGGTSSSDEELRAWRQQRSLTIPWRQLCLMATICFGVASFVLPAGVNRAVDWLLYALTGMSLYAWLLARRSRTK